MEYSVQRSIHTTGRNLAKPDFVGVPPVFARSKTPNAHFLPFPSNIQIIQTKRYTFLYYSTTIHIMSRTECDLNEAFCLENDESSSSLLVSATLDASIRKTPPHSPVRSSASSFVLNELIEHRQDNDSQEDESLALARQLMAEEAMASYQSSFQLLQQHATQFSPEDYQAMQAAMMEEDDQLIMAQLNEDVEDDEGNGSAYETLLDLSERIGDVKAERWSWRAPQEIAKLPVFVYSATDSTNTTHTERDDSECKCLVCQCEYENGEQLCRLPCNHSFHADCVQPWLMKKDVCPYCRQCIVKD